MLNAKSWPILLTTPSQMSVSGYPFYAYSVPFDAYSVPRYPFYASNSERFVGLFALLCQFFD